MRSRPSRPLRPGRPDLSVQHRRKMPVPPCTETASWLVSDPALAWRLPLDNASWPQLSEPARPVPDLNWQQAVSRAQSAIESYVRMPRLLRGTWVPCAPDAHHRDQDRQSRGGDEPWPASILLPIT